MAKYKVGDEVYWTDPDNGLTSAYYTVKAVYEDGTYMLKNEFSETAAFEHELS